MSTEIATDEPMTAAAARNMSVTLNACQAVTSSRPTEYQGRKPATSRPRPPRAPTSSPSPQTSGQYRSPPEVSCIDR